MRMPRVRFTVRVMMIAVAAVAVAFGLCLEAYRQLRLPRDAPEALSYVNSNTLCDPLHGISCDGCDEASARRLSPGEVIAGQTGALYEVICIWRDGRVGVWRSKRVLIMPGGYRMELAPDPPVPE